MEERKAVQFAAICACIAVILNGISDVGRSRRYEEQIDAMTEKQAILETKIESLINLSFFQKKPPYEANRGIIDGAEDEVAETVEPEWIEYLCTAYCGCEKCVGKWHTEGYTLTASGWAAQEGLTIAADESYPFGTVLYLEGLGERVVMDRGSAITGNRIDVYFESHEDALAFGMRQIRGYLVEVPE